MSARALLTIRGRLPMRRLPAWRSVCGPGLPPLPALPARARSGGHNRPWPSLHRHPAARAWRVRARIHWGRR